jgi:hypothetical protein
MGRLFDQIRAAVADGRVLVSSHADDAVRERGMVVWQVITGLAEGRLLLERPSATPNPVAEVEQVLSDGTPVKAVWAYIVVLDAAKLVTVHYFDR